MSILHKEFNLPNPLADNWIIQFLLNGIKITKGQPPIIPYIMLKTFSNLIYVTVWYLLLDRLPTFLLRRIA